MRRRRWIGQMSSWRHQTANVYSWFLKKWNTLGKPSGLEKIYEKGMDFYSLKYKNLRRLFIEVPDNNQ